jgi:hypothetical protein
LVGRHPLRSLRINYVPFNKPVLHRPVELALFTEFGFVRDRQIAKWRWVMRTDV